MDFVSSRDPRAEAAKALEGVLGTHQGTPVLLLVSGGSAMSLLDAVDSRVLGPHLTLTVLDERYPLDSASSNFAALERTNFYAQCVGARVVIMKQSFARDFSSYAQTFAAMLHAWRVQYPGGVVIATLGVGSDGHTAGIFPDVYRVIDPDDAWVSRYVVPPEINPFMYRVTVSRLFLEQEVDIGICYVSGQDKYDVLHTLQRIPPPPTTLPAHTLQKMKKVIVFTDEIYSPKK
ncbi:MAG: Glucosamine-6-phosphate isomerase/6-phosphogluconolactonase [Candidatus Parcubacteria bacterium]|jgi:6-phosphogluconolactonase/glucosamine-6-phosphate isomerase/deaminase